MHIYLYILISTCVYVHTHTYIGDRCLILDAGANTLSLFSRHCSRLAPVVMGFRMKGNTHIFVNIYIHTCLYVCMFVYMYMVIYLDVCKYAYGNTLSLSSRHCSRLAPISHLKDKILSHHTKMIFFWIKFYPFR
jgi:hypothetical protein